MTNVARCVLCARRRLSRVSGTLMVVARGTFGQTSETIVCRTNAVCFAPPHNIAVGCCRRRRVRDELRNRKNDD